MHKIMIVDDEALERHALQTMISRLFNKTEVVASAANGRQAIELADEYRPDVITMDIKLPGMDGLQTIEEIQKSHPQVHFIVLSAFDTFSYAKKAMALNVKHYLLKPYKQEELYTTFTSVFNELAMERKTKADIIRLKDQEEHIRSLAETEWVSTVINEQIQDLSAEELSSLLKLTFSEAIALNFRFTGESFNNPALKTTVYQKVKMALKESERTAVGPLQDRNIPVFLFKQPYDRQFQTSLRNDVIKEVSKVSRHLEPLMETEPFSFTAGAGSAVASLSQLQNSFLEAMISSKTAGSSQKVNFYSDSEIGRSSDYDGTTDIYTLEKELILSIKAADSRNIYKLFQAILNQQLSDGEGSLAEAAHYMTELFVLISRELALQTDYTFAHFYNASSVNELKQKCFQRLELAAESAKQQSMASGQDLFNTVTTYIHNHFDENISLETAAHMVELSPTYFSKLFKEETGQTFIDYISLVRISKAKQLLTSSNMSLKEICFHIGYHDPNYFSRVFKKYERVSPREYRQEQKSCDQEKTNTFNSHTKTK